jgi:hypothetical protein
VQAVEKYGQANVGLPEGPPFFQFSDAVACRKTVNAAGFSEVDVVTLPLTWVMTSPDAAFEALSQGGRAHGGGPARANARRARADSRRGPARRRSVLGQGRTSAIPVLVVLSSGMKT